MKKIIVSVAFLLVYGVAGNIFADDVYTMGNDTNHTVEQWDVGFADSTTLATDGNVSGTPQVIAVADLHGGNIGNEIIWGRSDGYTIVTDTGGVRVASGAALDTRGNHLKNGGFLDLAVYDVYATNAGNEIITVAVDGYVEIWAYSDSGLGSRLHFYDLDGLLSGSSGLEDVTFGEFDSSNDGLELAALRNDGYVEIWNILGTGSRLAFYNLDAVSHHDPFTHFFSGDLDTSAVGDELATVGTDRYFEILTATTGVRIGSYVLLDSDVSDNLDFTAAAVPPVGTLIVIQ